ncbi:hypothetical protein SBOR_0489 [Sclerotinia borealis F-4128]|uniref:Glutamine repeat protein-1 n=1 Tax=Sclerotinia borealis (strain F-4128) TaxID=1432307 RepID=W9CWR1_SCLBF|nr:hypothetical protein SBOR_0489 [Sclerotinia borealis F-4128]
MYAPNFSFGQGNSTQSFNPNGGHPQAPQNVHQPGQQQPQHMMYNTQQYGAGGHQSPYGTSGPGMASNAGGMGMMQNNGAHMAGGNVPSYQTPYTSSPYGNNIATSSSVSHPPSFMPTTSNAPPQYGMNPSTMIPQQQQHQIQRMQPPPSSTPTPTSATSRVSPYGNFSQSTPPSASTTQFAVPKNLSHQHHQTPNNPQQGAMSLTPQTPNFPPGSRNPEVAGTAMATPLSPGSELREKERVTVLLDINGEILIEVMRIIALQTELKSNQTEDPAEKAKLEAEHKVLASEYIQCMRRLQSNLAYLAAIADRTHKPAAQVPSHPAVLFAPSLTPKPAHTDPTSAITNGGDSASTPEERYEDRSEILKDLYKRLQALYPGVDPKKEIPAQSVNAVARAQAQAQQHAQQMQSQAQKQGDMGQSIQNMTGGQNVMGQGQSQNQSQGQGQGQMVQGGMAQMQQHQQQGQQNMGISGLNQNQLQQQQLLQQQQQHQHQQKMQNEMMRQRMMQEAQKSQQQHMMNMGQMPGR